MAVVEVAPEHCPNGHPLVADTVVVLASVPVRGWPQRAPHVLVPGVRNDALYVPPHAP